MEVFTRNKEASKTKSQEKKKTSHTEKKEGGVLLVHKKRKAKNGQKSLYEP